MTTFPKPSRPTPEGEPAWDPNRGHIRVLLRDVQTEAHIGLHPWERHPERPSRLTVNIEMLAATDRPAIEAGAPALDYDPLRAALRTWPHRPHTDLLETLVEELVTLCFANPHVDACRVAVVKPDIFNEAAGVGVEVFRVRARAQPG